jgi:ABC-type transporter Mla MlaB component/chromosome segregation ATPase
MSLHIIQSDANTLAIANELTDSDAPELARALEGLKNSEGIPTVDLSAVGQVSARCIGALVAAWIDLVAAEKWFELRASDAIWHRLGVAGVARIFFHRPGSAAAVAPTSRAALFGDGVASLVAKQSAKQTPSPRSDASRNAEIDRYIERIAALEGELTEARERENTAVSERNDLGIELRGKAGEIAQLRSEIEDVRAEAEGMRGSVADLEVALERVAELERQVEEHESNKGSLAAELEVAQGRVSELECVQARAAELERVVEERALRERALAAELEDARDRASRIVGARERIVELERLAEERGAKERLLVAELADAHASIAELREAAAKKKKKARAKKRLAAKGSSSARKHSPLKKRSGAKVSKPVAAKAKPKAAARKSARKKPVTKKSAKKTPAKRTPAKKTPAKKKPAKKKPVKKKAARKTTPKKKPARRSRR